MTTRRSRSVWFTAPGRVELREEQVAVPAAGEVGVRTLFSAISSGTEKMVLLGEVPEGMNLDEELPGLKGGSFHYPFQYGYAVVGRIEALGPGVPEDDWLDRLVFAFRPHRERFTCSVAELHPVPEGVSPRRALLLPTVETAVGLVQDGGPRLGEEVALFGLGLVGATTAQLLQRFPLNRLVLFDVDPERRAPFEGEIVLDPSSPDLLESVRICAPGRDAAAGADLVFELSGQPEALDQAIAVTGYGGRVIVGSWYGDRTVELALGGRFHRQRIRLISSQVSTLAPSLRGRWTKQRRHLLAWELLGELALEERIGEELPVERAQEAYERLAEGEDAGGLTVLSYGGGEE